MNKNRLRTLEKLVADASPTLERVARARRIAELFGVGASRFAAATGRGADALKYFRTVQETLHSGTLGERLQSADDFFDELKPHYPLFLATLREAVGAKNA